MDAEIINTMKCCFLVLRRTKYNGLCVRLNDQIRKFDSTWNEQPFEVGAAPEANPFFFEEMENAGKVKTWTHSQ